MNFCKVIIKANKAPMTRFLRHSATEWRQMQDRRLLAAQSDNMVALGLKFFNIFRRGTICRDGTAIAMCGKQRIKGVLA